MYNLHLYFYLEKIYNKSAKQFDKKIQKNYDSFVDVTFARDYREILTGAFP